MIYLSKFDLKFEFLSEKKNIIADLLSRVAERSTYQHDLSYLKESDDDDDSMIGAIQLWREKTLLEIAIIRKRSKKSRSRAGSALTSSQSVMPEAASPQPMAIIPQAEPTSSFVIFDLSSFCESIMEEYKENMQFKKALKKDVKSDIYELRKGLLYMGSGKNELCIPNVRVNGGRDEGKKNLRELLILHYHEDMMNHLETVKTAARLHEDYYWKISTADVKKYIDSCHLCQMKKTSPTKQYDKNHPLPIPDKSWKWISMDFLMNLPSSALNDQKYNILFIVVCMLSKQVHLILTMMTVKAEGIAKLYFDQIYRLHGLLKAIISDRNTKFTGAFWRTLQKMVGTDLMMSMTDHPQIDG